MTKTQGSMKVNSLSAHQHSRVKPPGSVCCVLMMIVLGAVHSGAWAQSCQMTSNVGNSSFNISPYAITVTPSTSNLPLTGASSSIGYLDENGVVQTALPSSNRWSSSSSGFNLTLTFSTPVPAHWIGLAIIDVGHSTGGSYSPSFQFQLSGVDNTATVSDFSLRALTGSSGNVLPLLSYNPATGVVTKTVTSGTAREHGVLVGNSNQLVRTLTLSTGSLRSNDSVGLDLLIIPRCVSVDKVSNGGIGGFDFNLSNLVNNDASSATTTSVTTTTAGSVVSSGPFYVANRDAVVSLAETVDEDAWVLTSTVCSDANAGINGNSGEFGTLSGSTLTIPAANLPANADIHCLFNNRAIARDLQITKTASSSNALTGQVVTFTLVASNNGPDDAANVVVSDTPGAGLDCSSPSSTATCQASGGASCPGPTVTVSDLTGAGITIASFPVQGQVTISLQCTVTASGSP